MTKTTKEILEFGKMPPNAIDMEEAILGAIMIENNSIENIIDILNPECFYKDKNQKIYESCVELFKDNSPTDILAVTEKLRQKSLLEEVGGPYHITELTNKVSSAANIEYHSMIVAEKYMARELIRISTEIQVRAYDNDLDIEDLLDFSNSSITNIKVVRKQSRHISSIQKERISQLREMSDEEKKYTGIPSGFIKMDRITSGWQDSDLIILAARPSMGKSTLALEFAINAAEKGFPVDMYSLEMKDLQLYDKTISRKTGIENSFLRTGKINDLQWKRIEHESHKIDNLPIYIDDTPSLGITELKAKTRRNHSKYNTRMIIVDYLQLMKSADALKRGGREREIADISSQLKSMAKELDVPVIALSQLNRSVESRSGNKRPQLSDLRESGAIEQDADMVIFIHRPEYYGIERDSEGKSTKNMIEMIVAKHRNGVIGNFNFWKNNNWTDIREFNDDKQKETLEFDDDLPY